MQGAPDGSVIEEHHGCVHVEHHSTCHVACKNFLIFNLEKLLYICYRLDPWVWRRKWQPTPVFLPGESQGRGSLVNCHLRGRTELDTTEAT